MCGIFGYIGTKNALHVCLNGLKMLEYRGYDSTGIAGIRNGEISLCKAAGKLEQLEKKITLQELEIAIGHTRWATHGKVNDLNAHPHLDTRKTIALVHNGIIENYDDLKRELEKEGAVFYSETDTEVIVQLIAKNYEGDLLRAIQKIMPKLKGHFAICAIHKNHPDQMVVAVRDCSLSAAYDDAKNEAIISSDPNTFIGKAFNVLFLRNNEIARIEKGKVTVFNQDGKILAKESHRLEAQVSPPSKNGFEHFMLKEIFEQPGTVQRAYLGRIEKNKVHFEELREDFSKYRHVWFIGCGTSAHAGSIGALFLEQIAQIPARSEIASEARYRILPPETLVVAISQSGETADTIAAVKEIKAKGFKVLGICNVQNSALPRETDGCIFLKAGPEISVCSTKAFTSQIAILYLFAHYMAKKEVDPQFLHLQVQIQHVLDQMAKIAEIGKKYSKYNDFFFMGRHYMYPTCLEAALKLKEISYVNANGYPAGELKHGPIALIDAQFPVIAFCANRQTEDKILSNLQEVKARGAPILAFAPEHLTHVSTIADDVIWLKNTTDELAPFASCVAGQLFAYFVAKERGCNIDQPRNLAKSVTVE